MKRQIILRGAEEVLGPGHGLDPGSSAYTVDNTPSKKLYEVWNNKTPVITTKEAGGHLVTTGEYGYCQPVTAWWMPPDHTISFEKGPTLAIFTKVTLTCGFDYSQTGPNNWYFPPTNDHGPMVTILLRKRDKTTYQEGTGTATWTMGAAVCSSPCPNAGNPSWSGHNVNINTQPAECKPHPLSWEMLAHPEGGPWTLEDINNLVAGVRYHWANKPGAKAYNPAQGGFFKIRVPFFTVTLDIMDLGGFVANVRTNASMTLRLMRRARNVIKPASFIDQAPSLVGQRVYMSHPKGPSLTGSGWGQRSLERRAGLVLARQYMPEEFKVEDEVYDLNAYNCLGWATYRIDTAWNPELQGVALVDKGMGWVHVRDQDAWSPRPGDGVLNRVIDDYPNVCFHGLAAQGGGDESVCLRNYDVMQSGWSTVSSSGSFSVVADTAVTMAEEQGYLSTGRLTYGPAGGTGGREKSLGSLTAGRLHVRVVVKNTSVPDPTTQKAEWYLRDASSYWDNTNRQWVGSPVYNQIASSEPFGEVVADAITIASGTYYVGVGRFSSAINSVTFHAALMDVQHTDTTVAGARTPLVTLDAAITRVADTHKMTNTWSRSIWEPDHGVAVVEVRPFWLSSALPDSTVKPLLHAQHTTNTWDALQFVHSTAQDVIRFERAISGETTFQLDCVIDASVVLSRAHVLRAWARWLGSEGWTQYAPYSVEVGYAAFTVGTNPNTGAETLTLLKTGSTVGAFSVTTSIGYWRSYLGIGCDETRYLDGYVRMWETRRRPIHGVEAIWRV